MENINTYLKGLVGDLFKILPMSEARDQGEENHLDKHIGRVLIKMRGALKEYPILLQHKHYANTIYDLQYLLGNNDEDCEWKQIVLSMTGRISRLCQSFSGDEHE